MSSKQREGPLVKAVKGRGKCLGCGRGRPQADIARIGIDEDGQKRVEGLLEGGGLLLHILPRLDPDRPGDDDGGRNRLFWTKIPVLGLQARDQDQLHEGSNQ